MKSDSLTRCRTLLSLNTIHEILNWKIPYFIYCSTEKVRNSLLEKWTTCPSFWIRTSSVLFFISFHFLFILSVYSRCKRNFFYNFSLCTSSQRIFRFPKGNIFIQAFCHRKIYRFGIDLFYLVGSSRDRKLVQVFWTFVRVDFTWSNVAKDM